DAAIGCIAADKATLAVGDDVEALGDAVGQPVLGVVVGVGTGVAHIAVVVPGRAQVAAQATGEAAEVDLLPVVVQAPADEGAGGDVLAVGRSVCGSGDGSRQPGQVTQQRAADGVVDGVLEVAGL